MNDLRVVYRNIIAETILLFAVAIQIISGIKLFLKKRKANKYFFEKLQIYTGKDGIERENAYADEGLFFKLGSYNQTNGITTGAETHNGDLKKQYKTGNYAEVWFKNASIYVSDAAVSNEGYFTKND